MNQSFIVCQVAPPEASKMPPRAKRPVGQLATMFLVGLTLCLVLLGVTMMMLRRHQHRARRQGGLAEELEAAKLKKKFKPDAWTEAGRRLDPNKPLGNEDDGTVDIDPRELLPEDIQPPDDTPPQNGHGRGGSSGSGSGGGKGGPKR